MIGGLIAIVVPYGTQARWGGDVNDLRAFRVALYAALALPTITLILELFLLVESPYYLLMRGRKEEARKSLDYINGTAPGYDSDRALAELEYTLEKEAELATLVRHPSVRHTHSPAHFYLRRKRTLATWTASRAWTVAGLSAPSSPPSLRTSQGRTSPAPT